MNCVTCKKAIHDAIWGDFKCSVHQRAVSDHEITNCKHYDKGTPMESKKNSAYYETHLRDC